MEDFKFYVSFGKNARDNTPFKRECDWREFVASCASPTSHGTLPLSEYLKANKPTKMKEKDGPYFIPASFSKSSRLAKHVEALYAFVCDFDSGAVTSDLIYEKLKEFTYVAWTSYSNSLEKPKWRVVIPYDSSITPEQHEKVFEHMQVLFGGELDPRCETTNQLWYLPRCPVDADPYFRCLSNLVEKRFALVDAKLVAQVPSSQVPAAASLPSASLDDLIEVLTHISTASWNPGGELYDKFLKVGMAIYYETKGSEQGYKLFDAWAKDNRNTGYGDEDLGAKWHSFKNAPEKPVTAGTLYHFAKEQGWVPTTVHPRVAELNEKLFVAPIRAHTYVWRKSDEGYIPMLVKDVATLYANHKMTVRKKDKIMKDGSTKVYEPEDIKVFDFWLQHPQRREYDRVVFAPNGCREKEFNLWRGFGIEPKPGDWSLLERHLKEVICFGEPENYEYLMNWLAYSVQRPEKIAGVAVVLRGGRGVGKSLLTDLMRRIFGEHSMKISQPRQMSGNFNAHLSQCVFLVGEESLWSGNRADEQVIKDMITGGSIMIERKGIDATEQPSCLHVMFNSNNDWAIPAGHDERRFFVLQVSPQYAQDPRWFEPLFAQLEAGGDQAFLAALLDRSLDGFNIFKVPQTDALRLQKLQSMDTLEEWWYQKLLNGKFDTIAVGHSGPEAWGIVPAEVVFQDYVKSVGNIPYGRKTATKVGMFLHKIHSSIQVVKVDRGVVPVRAYQLPDLEQCRAEFEDYMRTELNWSTGS